MAAGRSIWRRGPASRFTGANFRYTWCGFVRSRSPTGWWPSSACRSRVGAATASPDHRRECRCVVGECRTARLLSCAVLEELRITGLGVIEDATLALGDGLTVITGETGAGKTMVVTSLGLLFGGRADAGRVR